MRASEARCVLEVNELSVGFGGLLAVNSVTFDVHEGERTGLIGPNGAGKSTIMNAINGLVPASGSVRLFRDEGEPIELLRQKPYRLRRMGIARTFQSPQLIEDLTIEENVALGTYFERGAFRRRDTYARTEAVLEACSLASWRQTAASAAPHGVKKLADLARCLIGPSHLLLLDEPGAGLSTAEKELVVSIVRSPLAPKAIVIVDHDIDFVREVVDSLAVLDFGQLVISGDPDEVLAHPEVRTRYFGV